MRGPLLPQDRARVTPADRHFAHLSELLARHAPAALVFDCDGTLTDSMPVHYIAWREALEPVGLRFDETRFYAMAGIPTDRILHQLSREQGIPIEVAELSRIKEERFLVHLDRLQPIEPVARLARHSHGEMPISVASGGFREIVDLQLRKLQLRHLFDVVVTAEDTLRHKPEPDVFLEAADRMKVPPQVCCVLEDSDLGIEAARRAGMSWIDVRPYHPPRS